MGSTTATAPAGGLPASTAPSLVLTQPTAAEREKVWTLTHTTWGSALSLADYLEREAYLTTVPLAKDGGITHWILTDGSPPSSPSGRPMLSSCETLRKRAVACAPGGEVRDGVAHGIASVFTDPAMRGRGYAARMLAELGPQLGVWQADGGGGGGGGECLFSVLYSDIGKTFYASKGWAVFESSHLAFPPAGSDASGEGAAAATPFGYHELAALCAVDERLLRARLKRRAGATGRTCVALLPDLDAMLWHLMREDFMTQHIFGRVPAVKGAVATAAADGRRMWAVWTRGYYGGLEKTEGNTLHVLRVVVEGHDEDEAEAETEPRLRELADGFRAILAIARREAAEWRVAAVHMWNPTPLLMRVADASGLDFTLVHREADSIASLMWYGGAAGEDLDWVANEKYGWC